MPFPISILPRDRSGQFGSANQNGTVPTVIAGSIVAGKFIDRTTSGSVQLSGCRYLYLWQFVCQFVSLIAMIFVYRSWRWHREPSNYIPPMVATR